ncbi:MAG TPA: hypothetical protein VN224_11810 [Xanthomonadales bacterium]|nr:hypothetical protein [Xanthomonadales bacterium]
MQHTTGVAVVATQLAETDRRALSQAWYSALHLADRPPSAAHAPLARVPCASPPSGSRFARGPNDVPDCRSTDAGTRARDGARSASSRCDGSAGIERRGAKTELARRIEQRLTRRLPRGVASSFAVRGADGRVHLVVRSDGALTRIVAVCAPPLRERVERALAQARFALAGRGVRTEVA